VARLAVCGVQPPGVVPPIHRLAEKVHAVGGRILVDTEQLAPHRPIDMRRHDDPGHLDFVALSTHKMDAPFGSGALIGSRAGFGTTPDHCGGGTVRTNWRPLVHWLLVIPHVAIVYVVGSVSDLLAVISWFAVLFTGRLLAGLANFQAM
jgi:Aminotransferase class-V